MSRRLLAATAAAALTFSLAACGDGESDTAAEPPPAVAQSDGGGDDAAPTDNGGTTEAPVEAAPDVPAPDPADYPGMDENTPEGAEQAFRYFVANIVWARQTGESDAFAALHTEDCASCQVIGEEILDSSLKGEYWSDVVLEDVGVDNFESTSFDVEIGYIFILSDHRESGSGGPISEQSWTSIGGLNWGDDGWKVGDYAVRETGGD